MLDIKPSSGICLSILTMRASPLGTEKLSVYHEPLIKGTWHQFAVLVVNSGPLCRFFFFEELMKFTRSDKESSYKEPYCLLPLKAKETTSVRGGVDFFLRVSTRAVAMGSVTGWHPSVDYPHPSMGNLSLCFQ